MQSTPTEMMPVILQRLAGNLTAVQAARHLGVSRKTYYQWEARALEGMKAALEPGLAGRPRQKPDAELTRAETQNQQLQRQVESLEQRLRCRQVLAEADTRAKKK